jgi:hypothetical protein
MNLKGMQLLLRWSAIRAAVLFKTVTEATCGNKTGKGEEHIIGHWFVEELLAIAGQSS